VSARGQTTRLFRLRPRTTNIGNDLIGLATDGLLESEWPGDLEIVTLPASAVGGAKGSGLDAGNVYAINQLGDGVLVGSGNLFENGGLNVDPTALGALQVPLGFLAISSGRVYGREGTLVPRTDAVAVERIRALCDLALPLLVRDDATAAYLESVGIEHAIVAGCPTLFSDVFVRDLPPPDETLAGKALLSVRNPQLMSIPNADQERVRRDIAKLIRELRGRYDDVVLVCHDYKDLAFAAAFPEARSLYTEDPHRFISWLRGGAVSITYRLHAFLTCVSYAQRSIHISYDERGESMIDTLGLEGWNVRLQGSNDVPGDVMRRDLDQQGRAPKSDAAASLELLGPAMKAGVQAFAERVVGARQLAEATGSS
jgi:hypothetical protein